jgi:hypothetical protein
MKYVIIKAWKTLETIWIDSKEKQHSSQAEPPASAWRLPNYSSPKVPA